MVSKVGKLFPDAIRHQHAWQFNISEMVYLCTNCEALITCAAVDAHTTDKPSALYEALDAIALSFVEV